MIHPPILPSCLDFLFPPHEPRHHIPPISAHVVVVPPLIDNAKYIDSGPRYSSPQQVHPVPLDVLPSPLSSCLQKQEIVQNDPANRSSSLLPALALSVCRVSPMAPSFSMACCRCNISPGRSRISIAYGRMANPIFLRGSQRKRVWILAYCQTIPPPPPKGECLECASVTLLRPAGRWRGDMEGERG